MGPSGGGKTSLLNAITNRAGYADLTGIIEVAGVPDGLLKFPDEVGFVPQDDIMLADLTVYQNLRYAADLRLPADMSAVQKSAIVEDVLEVLEIGHIRDSMVGDAHVRGISGGQKKRVNIGLELVAYPRVLFLDEPTSGLDSTAALEVSRCLLRLRSLGITSICVIHQPRFSVFQCFTHLLLLAPGGRLVYSSDTTGLHAYLTAQGFTLPEGENVADWMLDVVAGTVVRRLPDGTIQQDFDVAQLVETWRTLERKRLELARDDKDASNQVITVGADGDAAVQKKQPRYVLIFDRSQPTFTLFKRSRTPWLSTSGQARRSQKKTRNIGRDRFIIYHDMFFKGLFFKSMEVAIKNVLLNTVACIIVQHIIAILYC